MYLTSKAIFPEHANMKPVRYQSQICRIGNGLYSHSIKSITNYVSLLIHKHELR